MISVNKTVAENKRARFDYEILETFEAGIMLCGTEVKSLRLGQCSLAESYVGPKDGNLWLWNANIPEYQQAGPKMQHQPQQARKLLLHKQELNKIIGAANRDGQTIIALKLYFNARGIAKLEIAIGRGKKQHDKRDTEKKRDWNKQKNRLMREKG
ncbi:MAG: SsrA-binding protein SmpB [Bdellovibrionales bacterium]